jgi:putative ABC transport system permease protein
MLLRALRGGEARIVLLALVVAVASLTSVSFFADRVQRQLERQAGELIGGDLALVADQRIAAGLPEVARERGLQVAQTATFPSMVSVLGADEPRAHLAEIKAVSGNYPLRGKVRLVDREDQVATDAERDASAAPTPGSAWVAPQLVSKIGAAVGSRLKVGNLEVTVTGLIAREPDSVLDYFGLAPRVLINQADLGATGLIQVGSRVTYRMLMAGDEGAIASMRAKLAETQKRGQRLESPRDARSEVRVSLDRAGKFLSLAALLSVVLAAAAVALAARRYSERNLDAAALMRCLGATRNVLLATYVGQFLLLALLAGGIGSALGLLAQYALASALASVFATQLPPPSWLPLLHGLAVGLTLAIGFTVPPLLRLRNAPALRVLRRELSPAEPLALLVYGLGFAALAGLIIWRAGELKLGATAVAGFTAALAAAAVAGLLLVRTAAALRSRTRGALRFGLANLARRAGVSVLQIGALGIGIMAILLLTLVQSDLLERWQGRLPADAPNRFAINIQNDQLAEVRRYFAGNGLATPDLYPMVRGRLVEKNGQPVKPREFSDLRAQRLAEREFNLTWARESRPDNPVIAGAWWAPDSTSRELSLEEGIARTLNVKLGDSLTWEVAGSRFTGRVTSLRKVDWDSFKPNFFVVASPGMLEGYPASYITSFSLKPGNEGLVNTLVARFPNISVIDLTAIMAQVKRITEQVSKAVEFVFIFALLAGGVVLYAAIIATQDERVFEGAVMRTLGAHRSQLRAIQAAEFSALGLLAGAIAVGGAWVLGKVLAEQLLQVSYNASPQLIFYGLGAGVFGVTVAGLLGTRKVVDAPPMESMRSVL